MGNHWVSPESERGEETGTLDWRAETAGFRAARGKRDRGAGRFRAIRNARGRDHRASRAPALRGDVIGESGRPIAAYALANTPRARRGGARQPCGDYGPCCNHVIG